MSDRDRTLLRRNCEALAAAGAPELALAVRRATPAAAVRVAAARDGSPVPVVSDGDRDIWLHSRYSPEREAERACDAVAGGETVVALSLAGGYHLHALVERRHCMPIVVLPEAPETLAVTLRQIDLSTLVGASGVRIIDGSAADRALPAIASGFVPLFSTGLSLLAPAGVSRAFPRLHASATATISRAREIIADDVTAQKRFGLLWMRNIVLNLPIACATAPPPRFNPKVIVAGAGPGLERWLAKRDHDCERDADIIATDTAWPALRRSGHAARFAVSVDPSPYTYHHLLCGGCSGTWLLDVGAAPVLWRAASAVRAVRNRHPLVSLFESELAHLTTVVRGGDVSEVAVEIAASNGATGIVLRGTDYGYPAAKTYARGTYVATLFESAATRLNPIEALHLRLAFRSDQAHRDEFGVIRTPGLSRSYDRMRSIASRLAPEVRVIFPEQAESPHAWSSYEGSTAHEEDGVEREGRDRSKQRCLERMSEVRRRMLDLRFADPPSTAEEYWKSLSRREYELVAALVPAALATKAPSWDLALEQARIRFVEVASIVLQRGKSG